MSDSTMNPAPCIPIEAGYVVSCGDVYRTRAQIRKGLLRVWLPGATDYFLWIPNTPRYEAATSLFMKSPWKRWWQPPC